MPRPKGKTIYNPTVHCGSENSSGNPCTHVKGWGTDHLSNGRCRLHGGASTGPKTAEGKAVVSQNARKHGLYSKVLSGADAVRYQAVMEYDPSSILNDGFYLIHSRMVGLLEGEGKFDSQSKLVLQACEVLAEEGQLTEEFVEELRLKLLNLDVERMARIMNSTVNLANASVFLDKMGNVKHQNEILKRFVVDIIKTSRDRAILELAVTTISQLKLEAGLQTEDLQKLLERARAEDEELDLEDGAIED